LPFRVHRSSLPLPFIAHRSSRFSLFVCRSSLIIHRSSFPLSFIAHHSAFIVLFRGLVGRGAGLGQALVQLEHPLDS
jgi:hypothetical protein